MDPRLSWLCPTPEHRARFLDMQERLGPARAMTIISAIAITVVLAPKAGWPLLAACALTIGGVVVGSLKLESRRRPELWVFASTVLNSQCAVALGAFLAGGPRTGVSCLLAVPVVMVAARFSNRGLMVGAPVSALLVVATTLGADPAYVLANPESIVVPLAVVACTALFVSPLVASDLHHRSESTLDQLTGLLNRRALEARFPELCEQAAFTQQPVSLVSFDVDHFKRVNDEHGHAAGDAVLHDLAYALRHGLGTFELLYRLGGEEFLLVLPGAASEAAADTAERMRRCVEEVRPLGLPVTASFGVATVSGAEASLPELMRRADAALYAAKRDGRNRVAVSAGTGNPVAAPLRLAA